MNSYFLYIHLDDYLAQWFINDQGGKYPVELKRGSVESIILESFLAKQPEDIPQQTEANNPDAVKIAIPFFKSKDVNYFNYDAYARELFKWDYTMGANGNVFRVVGLRSSLSPSRTFPKVNCTPKVLCLTFGVTSKRKGSLFYTYC